MDGKQPRVVVLAGPNGAGKSTAAPTLLAETLEITEFVNADAIARGLSEFRPEDVVMTAGRIMLSRLKDLSSQGSSFAFETTLASRSFAPWIDGLRQGGYEFNCIFLWLPTVELALTRVVERIRQGGHSVPPDTIRRRYHAGLRNFRRTYQSLADHWYVYDSSSLSGPRLLAKGRCTIMDDIQDPAAWDEFQRTAGVG